jgi:hypothetical protein
VTDHLGQHRVVVDPDDGPVLHAGVDAGSSGGRIPGRRTGAVPDPEAVEGSRRRKPVGDGILGVEAHLDGVAGHGRLQGGGGKGLSRGDLELQPDEVQAGDRLGHGVLDLEPGVHLEEPELARAVDHELDRPRTDVADGPGEGHGGVPHASPTGGVEERAR